MISSGNSKPSRPQPTRAGAVLRMRTVEAERKPFTRPRAHAPVTCDAHSCGLTAASTPADGTVEEEPRHLDQGAPGSRSSRSSRSRSTQGAPAYTCPSSTPSSASSISGAGSAVGRCAVEQHPRRAGLERLQGLLGDRALAELGRVASSKLRPSIFARCGESTRANRCPPFAFVQLCVSSSTTNVTRCPSRAPQADETASSFAPGRPFEDWREVTPARLASRRLPRVPAGAHLGRRPRPRRAQRDRRDQEPEAEPARAARGDAVRVVG